MNRSHQKKLPKFEEFLEFLITLMEAVGVEPTSENISTRLSPSAGHNFIFAFTIAYAQAIVSAIFDYST
jgi:hypothetical protein